MSASSDRANQIDDASGPENNQAKFEALCRLIERGQGRFVLALISYDLPSQRKAVTEKLHQTFPALNLTSVRLTPLPTDTPRTLNVLDQLKALVKATSPDAKPDVLIITGYESLLPDARDGADEQTSEQLTRAIQPLNLGRNVLADTFNCPMLLFLPRTAMAVFLQSAPDLTSWRSGFYSFETDTGPIQAELNQIVQQKLGIWKRLRMRLRSPELLQTEARHLEALIEDAEAMGVDNKVVVRLYEQLGWRLVALGNRTQARRAFAEVLQLALPMHDLALIKDAERGQRAAEGIVPHTKVTAPNSQSVREIFRGAVALTEAEGLYGREEELRDLLILVTAQVEPRLLIVWGETGCGKSSLVLAGLIPELMRLGHYLPVTVRDWEEAELNVRLQLEETAGIKLDSNNNLHDCVHEAVQSTGKTVVLIFDQFEQFFSVHSQRSDRAQFLTNIGACVNDVRLSCKFLLIVREDALGHLAEFDGKIPEPLEQRKRFYLPLFTSADAIRVLREMAQKANLQWPDPFIRTVVADLTKDGRVRPIQLQLVAAALAFSGINAELDYARADRARGLLVDYLELVLRGLSSSKRQIDQTKRILLTLVADPPGRLCVTTKEIASRTGLSLNFVLEQLNRLVESHLVRRIHRTNPTEGTEADSTTDYELTHDILVDLVLIVTRGLQDYRREANRVLRRALEDSSVNPHHVIGLRALRLVSKYANEEELAQPQARSLLRRSFYWGAFKKIFIPLVVFISVLVFLQHSVAYVSFETDARNRIVLRRGLPSLGFLPFIGDQIILDTGLTRDGSLNPSQQGYLMHMLQWELGNRQSRFLERPELLSALRSPEQKAVFLSSLGRENESIQFIEDQLKEKTETRKKTRADERARAEEKALLEGKKPDAVVKDQNNSGANRTTRGQRTRKSKAEDIEKARNETEKRLALEAARILNIEADYDSDLESFRSELGDIVLRNPHTAEKILTLLKPPILRDFSDKSLPILLRIVQARADLGDDIVDLLLQSRATGIEPENFTSIDSKLRRNYDTSDDDYSVKIDDIYSFIPSNAYRSIDSDDIDGEINSDSDRYSYYSYSRQRAYLQAKYSIARIIGTAAKRNPKLVSVTTDHYAHALIQVSTWIIKTDLASADTRLSEPELTRLKYYSYYLRSLRHDLYVQFTEVAKQLSIADPETARDAYRTFLKGDDERLRIIAVIGLGRVAQAKPSLTVEIAHDLLAALNDDNHNMVNRQMGLGSEAYVAGIKALAEVVKSDPRTAPEVRSYFLVAAKSSEFYVRANAIMALSDLAQADHSEAPGIVDLLLKDDIPVDESSYYYEEIKTKLAFVRAVALSQAAQVNPTSVEAINARYLASLSDPDFPAKGIIPLLLVNLARARRDFAPRIVDQLLAVIKDRELSKTAIPALAKVVEMYPDLASRVVDPLLQSLKDWNLKEIAASSLVRVAEADSNAAGRIVGAVLHGSDQELRWKSHLVLGGLASVNVEARTAALGMLNSPDRSISEAVSDPISQLLVKLARHEEHPSEFLLEHLEGTRSLLENGDANTNAVYRHVVQRALTKWLVSDEPNVEQEQRWATEKLMHMHQYDSRVYLRIAASYILDVVAAIRDKPPKSQLALNFID